MSASETLQQSVVLRALAEQVKLPLVQVARMAEIGQKDLLKDIAATADMTIKFVDSYLLSIELQELPYLELEPISAAAILQSVADKMNKLAMQYGCTLELDVSGIYSPVMADRQAVEAAYTNLVHAFIESSAEESKRIVLATHRNNHGQLVAGVFSDQDLTAGMLRRARVLGGRARQAMPQSLLGSGARVFVADSLLTSISTPLRAARHGHMTGLAAHFSYSNQLSLV